MICKEEGEEEEERALVCERAVEGFADFSWENHLVLVGADTQLFFALAKSFVEFHTQHKASLCSA